MSRRTIGPFSEFQNLPAVAFDPELPDSYIERMYFINGVLANHGCNCAGAAIGKENDPYFGSDLSELAIRCMPHSINETASDGTKQVRTVQIHLDTLQVEVDDLNELCVWIYEHSAPRVQS